MSFQSAEQTQHDRINLGRLVRHLEKSVVEENWDEDTERERWIKIQRTLQKIRHARKLLKNVQTYDSSQLRQSHLDNIRATLDRLEAAANDLTERNAPKLVRRPEPILPKIPSPKPVGKQSFQSRTQDESSTLPSSEDARPFARPSLPATDLLLSPSDVSPPPAPSHDVPNLIPASKPAVPSSSLTPAFAQGQNTQALHEELSAQLAQMATQLKRNAMHFSGALAKDQAAMKMTEEKLEVNYQQMQKERVRVRDFRGRSGGTTCLVLSSIIVVLVAFVVMVMIIRWT